MAAKKKAPPKLVEPSPKSPKMVERAPEPLPSPEAHRVEILMADLTAMREVLGQILGPLESTLGHQPGIAALIAQARRLLAR